MNSQLHELQLKAVSFHGHMCPGLAMGIKAAEIGLHEFGHDGDEDIVAIVETDMCGVDAIQALMGCTFGKGNLIFRDYGKTAFSFYRRSDGKSVRLVTREESKRPGYLEFTALREKLATKAVDPQDKERLKELQRGCCQGIMEMSPDDLFERKPVQESLPVRARILKSVVCAQCGEAVMESRIKLVEGRPICPYCLAHC